MHLRAKILTWARGAEAEFFICISTPAASLGKGRYIRGDCPKWVSLFKVAHLLPVSIVDIPGLRMQYELAVGRQLR